MVSDDEPVQRSGELHALAVGGCYLLAPGKAIGLLWAENDAECPCIQGEIGVEVGVTPEDLRRVVAAGIGRVAQSAETGKAKAKVISIAGRTDVNARRVFITITSFFTINLNY
jgi:hypothetical protein